MSTPDVRTPAGRAAILAVCEAATSGPWRVVLPAICDGREGAAVRGGPGLIRVGESIGDKRFTALARTALPEAIEYIAELEQTLNSPYEVRVRRAEARIAELEQSARWWKDRAVKEQERGIQLERELADLGRGQ